MDNRNTYKRGARAYTTNRGYGRYAVIVCGSQAINGERWLTVRFVDNGARMCVHPSSLVAA